MGTGFRTKLWVC